MRAGIAMQAGFSLATKWNITLSSVYQFLNEESIPLEVRKRSLCAKSYFFAVSTIKVAKL
jgi:hypothetical protein